MSGTAQNRTDVASVRRVTTADRVVVIEWEDGHVSRFPYIWLRHDVFFGSLPGGIPDRDVPLPPDDPETLEVSDVALDDGHLMIAWGDESQSTRHCLTWLRSHCLSPQERLARKHRPTLWDGEAAASRPWFQWDDISDTEVRFELLKEVLDYGFGKLRGVPATLEALEEVTSMFGPIHETGYGRTFDIRTSSELKLGANTSKHLGPHNDENYRHSPPGISFFHCLKAHPKGGASILVDGFRAAEDLRTADPAAFELLSTVAIDFAEISSGHDYRSVGRVVTCDREGDLSGIRFTDRTICPPDLPGELVEPVYKALRAFSLLLYRPESEYRYGLQPGEVSIFDYHRVLHGRTEFDSEHAERHLRNASVDRDEFHSNLRQLAEAVGDPVANLVFAPGALG